MFEAIGYIIRICKGTQGHQNKASFMIIKCRNRLLNLGQKQVILLNLSWLPDIMKSKGNFLNLILNVSNKFYSSTHFMYVDFAYKPKNSM